MYAYATPQPPRLQRPPLQDLSVNLSYVLKTFVAGIEMDTERCPDPEPPHEAKCVGAVFFEVLTLGTRDNER